MHIVHLYCNVYTNKRIYSKEAQAKVLQAKDRTHSRQTLPQTFNNSDSF